MAAFRNLKKLKTLEIGKTVAGFTAKQTKDEIWAAIRAPEPKPASISQEAKLLFERSQKLIEESHALIKQAEKLADEARKLAEQAAKLSERAKRDV